jgi:hypothetical protein
MQQPDEGFKTLEPDEYQAAMEYLQSKATDFLRSNAVATTDAYLQDKATAFLRANAAATTEPPVGNETPEAPAPNSNQRKRHRTPSPRPSLNTRPTALYPSVNYFTEMTSGQRIINVENEMDALADEVKKLREEVDAMHAVVDRSDNIVNKINEAITEWQGRKENTQ